jgi:amino acid adenylation domain-containing protein
LNRRANQLAHHLRALGVGPDVLVGLCVERSLEMVIGLLGILKAGGAYLPLDPEYPQARLSFMLQDSQVPVLLTQSHILPYSSFMQSTQPSSFYVLCLDADWPSIEQESDKNPASGVMPDNLAYVIYTSGSTGQPKGVMVRHGGLVNHALASAKLYELTPADRMLQFISLSFDASAEEIFPTLISGATLVLWGAGMGLSQLAAFCEQQRITILHLPAAFWHQWVDRLEPGGWQSSVRMLVVGGESASVDRLKRWARLVGPCKFVNAYGPTEATIAATVYQTECDESIARLTKIPIGRPIANAQVYLLDRHLQPVPIGVPGELYIGGAGLARGYLNRPELTAERFILHPSAARLYKTGDLARYLPDGNIEFIGRTDNQV